MSVFVFLGPTLRLVEARAELEASYLPPVSQGDIYRLARHKPRVIGIIDGYFERVPAVWHKEILWAMSQGIHVFGAASMGALRAAELACFGMQGVGAIFRAFQSGALRDDDEVAVRHGPAETGFQTHSEAMVDIRATLCAAEAQGVIGSATSRVLECAAKALFYPDRVYPLILNRAAQDGVPAIELNAFRAWVTVGRVSQKRADARELLRCMREFVENGPAPKQVSFRLENTLQWQRVTRFAGVAKSGVDGAAHPIRLDLLLDELGLEGDAYPRAHQLTLLSRLALAEAQSSGYDASEDDIRLMRDYFFHVRDLQSQTDIRDWLQENHLTNENLEELLRCEVMRARLFEKLQPEIVSQLPDHLRLVGDYSRLLASAQNKQKLLDHLGLQFSRLEDIGLTRDELLKWHFARIGYPLPADISAYACERGFATVDLFLRALLRDYCYRRALKDPTAHDAALDRDASDCSTLAAPESYPPRSSRPSPH